MMAIGAEEVRVKNIKYVHERYLIKFLIDPDVPTRQDTWGILVENWGSFFLSRGPEPPADEPRNWDQFGNVQTRWPLLADGKLARAWKGETPALATLNQFRKT